MRDLIMRLGYRASTSVAVSVFALLIAAPAMAQTVTVTNITTGTGYALTIPTVEATGTNLTEAQIRRIFTGDFAGTADALAELDAGSIRIPEITLSYDIPKSVGEGTEKATVVYRDIEITDIVDGVARSAAIGSSSVEGGSDVTMSFGRMATGTFDIGGLLAFYGLSTPTNSDEFKTLYADFAFDGATMAGPGFSCEIGGATLADFKARPLKVSFTDFSELMATIDPEATTLPPDVTRRLIDFYIDILTAFDSTPTQGDGFKCSGKDNESAILVTGGAIEMGGFKPGIYPHFAMNDLNFDVTGPEAGSIALGNFTWKQMDFSAPIAALKAAPAELTEAWFTENWRKLVPAIDGLSLANLVVDVPDPENKDSRVKASAGGFDISLANYVNGIPSRIGVTTSNVKITVPEEEAGMMLRAFGIAEVDLSQDLQLHWDQAAQTIVIDTLSIDAAELGAVKLSAVLGNATPELFSADNNIALVASMGLTLKQLKVDLDDRGVSSLVMAVAAAEENQDPTVMRIGIAGLAQAAVLGFIGTTPEAMAASEEIAAFIKTRPQVSVTLTAKDEAGLALPLLMAATENPAALAGQITIAATASGDPRPADKPFAMPEPAEQPAQEAPPADGAARPDDGVQSESQRGKQTLKN
jgi:hypothetical protein